MIHRAMEVIHYGDVTIQVERITPDIAREVLLHHNHGNRNISNLHVAILEANMEQTTWRFNGASIVFDKQGELIDGQHRLTALMKSGKSFDFIVVKNVPHEVIMTIDQEIKSRSFRDLLSIVDNAKNSQKISACVRMFYTLSKGRIPGTSNTTSKGVVTKDKLGKVTNDEMYDFYLEYKQLVEDAVKYSVNAANTNRILTTSDYAGRIVYLQVVKHHGLDKIYPFFNCLAGLNNATEAKVVNDLKNILIKDKTNRRTNPLSPDKREMLFRKAWNYYVTGQYNKSLRYTVGERISYI